MYSWSFSKWRKGSAIYLIRKGVPQLRLFGVVPIGRLPDAAAAHLPQVAEPVEHIPHIHILLLDIQNDLFHNADGKFLCHLPDVVVLLCFGQIPV